MYAAAFLLGVPVLVLTLTLKRSDRAGHSGSNAPRSPISAGALRTSRGTAGSWAPRSWRWPPISPTACMETYLPVLLSGHGVPAYQIGLIFSLQVLSIALTKPLFGKLADTVDRRIQILVGIVFLACSSPRSRFSREQSRSR